MNDNLGMQGKVNYGTQLFKGEGQAYAHYIQEGKRIPRRGSQLNFYNNFNFLLNNFKFQFKF